MDTTAHPQRARRPRRHLLRIVGIAAASITAVALAACSSGTGTSGAASDNTLVVAMTASDIPNLDTALAQAQGYEGVRFVQNQLYDGLTKWDLTSADEIPTVVPGLAESWEVNDELTEWTFTLRDGVTFHDGTPFDADAVIYNLERYVDTGTDHYYPELAGAAGLNVLGIASFAKVDDMTVTITTNGPWAYLPNDLTLLAIGSPTAIQELGNEGFAAAPVGTGPFVFESVERGKQLTLVANEDYWGGAPSLDRLILRPISDPTARLAALRSGEVNWIEVPTPDDVPALASAGYQVETNSYDHSWTWVLDSSKAPFDDIRVREALNYAIDRDSLVTDILKDTAEPAYTYISRGNAAFREEAERGGYDPEYAKELLAEAGYPDGFTMTLAYPTGGSGNMLPAPMNTALQADLAKIGVEVELVPYEWSSLLAEFGTGSIPGGANALNISLTFQGEGYWWVWFGSDSPVNVGGYSNPELDALIAQARTIEDPTERFDVYAQINEIGSDEYRWLWVVNDLNPRVLAPNVKGFVQPKSWFVDLTTVTVE